MCAVAATADAVYLGALQVHVLKDAKGRKTTSTLPPWALECALHGLQRCLGVGLHLTREPDCLYATAHDRGDKILGLFEDSHMMYEHDREETEEDEPSLMEMTKAAIDLLSQKHNGYYLLVDAGCVDHANHESNLHRK